MKKWIKVTLIAMSVVIGLLVLLMYCRYNIHVKAEKFMNERTKYTNFHITQSDFVICTDGLVC